MALVLQDRVRVTSTSTGNSTLVLGPAYTGFRTFASCIPDGSLVYYTIQNTAPGYEGEWEVGYGTYDLGSNSLLRNTGNSATSGIYSSSNANAYITFSAGDKQVFITYPSEQAVFQQPSGITEFNEGPISVVGANATPASFQATLAQFFSNEPGYSQLYVQNQSGDANASADIVAYNNLGDGASYFVDMGINSSNYNSGDYPIFNENDAYVFSGGNVAGTGASTDISRLMIGTSTANSNVVIFGGSVNAGAEIATFVASNKNVGFANNISVTETVFSNNAIITNLAYSNGNLASASNNSVLVTQAYVDAAVSNGFHVHTPVQLATTGPLSGTPTYNQPGGAGDGVGATLTASGVGTLDVDGQNADFGFRILVQSQANAAHNGIYTVTTEGTGGAAYVLTRATDADTYVAQSDTGLGGGDYFFVENGDTQAYFSFICTNDGVITFGSTNITFQNFSQVPVYTGIAPVNVSGQTIALTGIVDTAHGGTNLSTYTTGDIIYANATNTLTKLGVGSQYQALTVDSGNVPHWGTINLGSSAAVSGSLGATYGGTGQTTYTLGDIIYSDASNSLAKLAGQTTTTKKYLQQQGDGVNSAAPSWQQVAAADISGLAPSATTDTSNASNITSGTLPTGRISGSYTGLTGTGTLTAGTWNANVIAASYGGTGVAGTITGIPYANGASAYTAASAANVVTLLGSTAVANATYAVSAGSAGSATTATNVAAANLTGSTLSSNVTASSLTSVGTLTGGTWNANVVAVGYGGTGASTLTANNVIIGNGTSAVQFVAPGTSGNVLTSNGTNWSSQPAGGGFTTGTVMLFAQTSAPTGWTKNTVNYDNHALRVVTGTAGTGGTVNFTTAFASQTPSGSVSTSITGVTGSVPMSGGSVDGYTLTIPTMPSHNHTFPLYYNTAGPRYGAQANYPNNQNPDGNTNYTGGGGSHSHPFTPPTGTFSFSSGTASSSFTGNAINLAVKYLDVITATKD